MLFIPKQTPSLTFPEDCFSPFDQTMIEEDSKTIQALKEINSSRSKFQKWVQSSLKNALNNKEEF